MRRRPRAVLFDLGGALIWKRWLESPWVRRFESGACSPEAFAAGFITNHGFPLTSAAFLASFRGWVTNAFPGAFDLVRDVASYAETGCLSNTNVVHWTHNADIRALIGSCQHRFLSYEIGHVKPDTAIFEHAIASLGCAPEEIVFLDDNEPNVVAAKRLGIDATQVKGVAAARAALANRGVL